MTATTKPKFRNYSIIENPKSILTDYTEFFVFWYDRYFSVLDDLSNAAVIMPIADVTKSNVKRRSQLSADALENLKRKLIRDEPSSAHKTKDYSELMEAIKHKINSTDNRRQQLSLLTLAPAS